MDVSPSQDNPLVAAAANARRILTPAALRGIADSLCEVRNSDGGFPGPVPSDGKGHSAASDPYYTLFALMALAAAGRDEGLLDQSRPFLEHQWDQPLDPVHRHACFLALGLTGALREGHIVLLVPAKGNTTAYGLFLHALSVHVAKTAMNAQESEAVRVALDSLKTARGGYRNSPGADSPSATATAAAMMVRHWGGRPPEDETERWLLEACRTPCGFRNSPQAREPDLLSTAVCVFALGTAGRLNAELALECLDFAERCRRPNGGFAGHPDGGEPDCEYTFYALLIAGCVDL